MTVQSNSPGLLLVALCACFTCTAPCPAADKISCPDQIAESSVVLKEIGTGWTPYVASPLYLHLVAPTDGPPERLGQLKPMRTRGGADAWTDSYDLAGRYPEGKWIQCSYGTLNEVVLAKRLDDRITFCTVEGRKGGKVGQNVFRVVCR